ncbi:MAG: FliA/WhiG family RNA polymerase sigma factor [Gemmatimonadota bacterium]
MTTCIAPELEQPRPVSSLMNDPLWRAFRDQNSSEARDRLLDRYMPLVTRAAHYIRRRTADAIELDELISAGSVGLLQALDRFELPRGLAFSSYAVPRIQGAMIDQLRENDWAPRSVRRRERKVATATHRMTQQLGRVPKESEVAEELGLELGVYQDWRSEIARTASVSLEVESATPGGVDYAPRDRLVDSEQVLADEDLERQEEEARIRAAIDLLPKQERTVLSLYYYEELTSCAIAQVLQLTESRISQIRTRALARLRASGLRREGRA